MRQAIWLWVTFVLIGSTTIATRHISLPTDYLWE